MANQCSLLITVSEEKHKPYISTSHPAHYHLIASPMNDQDAELSCISTIILPVLQSIQKCYYKFENSVVIINI